MENPVPVDFVVNTFERTYRRILAPGYFQTMAAEHCYPFSRRVVLINNVSDRADAERRARELQGAREITDFYFVDDLLSATLQAAGLTLSDLKPNRYYSDCSLTAIFAGGSNFLVYCDADVRLRPQADWITPCIDMMAKDSRIAVANPSWAGNTVPEEAREFQGEFAIGYGFSDQLYLIRRSEFAKPIYRFRAPISLRYPMCERGRIFEQMVDSYMRVNRRMRATLTTAAYIHDSDEGTGHPKLDGVAKLIRLRNRAFLRLLKMLPLKDPRYRI